MKVYAGNLDGTNEWLVAAASFKAAHAAMVAAGFNTSLYSLRQYGGETGNTEQIAVAMSRPGTVFIAPIRDAFNASAYVAREPKK